MVLETLESPLADSNLRAEIGNEQRCRLHSDSLVSIKVSFPPLLPIADHKGTFVSVQAKRLDGCHRARMQKMMIVFMSSGYLATDLNTQVNSK